MARALNDLRLALGTRLGVTEDDDARTTPRRTTRPSRRAWSRGVRLADRRPGLPRPRPDGLSPAEGRRPIAGRAGRSRRYPRPRAEHRPRPYDAIVAHARRDHPDEACGVVAGRRVRPSDAVRADAQRRALADVLRVRLPGPAAPVPGDGRQRRGAGGRSTTRTPRPRPTRRAPTSPTPPSRTRTTCWCRPASPTAPEFRSFRIVDGVVTEEPVEVVEPAVDSRA